MRHGIARMKIYSLERTQLVRAGIGACWDFFSNPANLARITPPALDLRVLSELPPGIYEGQLIRYRVKPLAGIPMTWVSEITRVRERECFVDEQRRGPYALWHHEHLFTERGEGLVEVRDQVRYALPLGPLGRLMHALAVKQKINTIFNYRERAVTEAFGS